MAVLVRKTASLKNKSGSFGENLAQNRQNLLPDEEVSIPKPTCTELYLVYFAFALEAVFATFEKVDCRPNTSQISLAPYIGGVAGIVQG